MYIFKNELVWGDTFFDFIDYNKVSRRLYNPDTHELVEKKDSKIKRLTTQVKLNEERLKANIDSISNLKKINLKLEKKIDELNEELLDLKKD